MSKVITKRVLEDIRFANDIVEVISGYMTIKRAGTTFKACCPFHKEKTPSFSINPQKQICHCFGCGEGGDVFSFVMKYEGVDFVTAAKMLASRAGITLELDEDDRDGVGGPKKDVLFRLHAELAQFYQRCLTQVKSADHARKYIKDRGFTDEFVENFQIGYAPGGWNTMLKWGKKNKFSEEELEAAGVILQSSKPDSKVKYYDRFRDRLMFPIKDIQGRTIGFSGRVLESDPKAAKYVNSPETPLFHKSRVLYALDRARRAIVNAEQREAIVCEGQIDVIRCHSAGIENAVAAQGTAFTHDHASILKRYADSVVIVFDSDNAGQDAAIKTAQIFIESGMAVRVATLPGGSDPDSFIIEKGAEAFQKLVENAASAVGFQVSVLAGRENTKSEIGTMRTARAVLETVTRSTSAVQRAKLIQEAAERLNVPASALQDDLKKMKKPRNAGYEPKAAEAPKVEAVKRPVEEVTLCESIVYVVDFPELGELVLKYVPLNMITDRCCRQVVEAALNTIKTGRTIEEELREFIDETGELQSFSAGMLEAPTKVKGREMSRVDAVKDQIIRIWRRAMKLERDRLQKSENENDRKRSTELNYILKRSFNTWEDAVDAIELELD